jgi:hypothetical protein
MSSIRAATELWWAWAEVSGEQERAAFKWRALAKVEVEAERNPSAAMAQETKAAMSSIVAAGAALETLGRSLGGFVAIPPPTNGAANYLFATILGVFPGAVLSDSLRASVSDVFRMRNLTVHYAATFEGLGPHPLGIPTTWVARTFTVETAASCVDAFADLVTAVANPGTSAIPQAEWWASRNKFVGKALKARATAPLPLDLVP